MAAMGSLRGRQAWSRETVLQYRLAAWFVLLLLTGGGIAWADSLSELPVSWQARLKALPEADISGAEPAARQALETAREKTAELVSVPSPDPLELARSFGDLGNLYQLYAVHTLAEISYANARILEPENFRWAYYLGYLAFTGGRTETAIDWFEQAQRLNPDYPALGLRLGRAWYELGDFKRARKALMAVGGSQGLRAAALYYLGQIDLLDRDYEQAVKRLLQALAMDPEASRIHYPLARAYRALGEADQARHHLALQGSQMPLVEDPLVQELKALERGARPYYISAMKQVEQGQYQAAVDSFRLGLERDPDNHNAWISLSRALYLSGQPEQARQGLERVLSRVPNKVLAIFLLAVMSDGSAEREKAEALYREVLQIDPDHVGAHFFLAGRLLQRQAYSTAAKHYAASGSDNPPALLYRLVALYRSGAPDASVRQELQADIARHPELQMLKYALTRLLALSQDPAVRDPAQAVALATELVMGFAIPPYLEALALAQASAGNFEQAIMLQNQLLSGAAWMGGGPLLERWQTVLDGFEQGQLPAEPWPEDDPLLTPQPVDTAAVFREYPSAVPY